MRMAERLVILVLLARINRARHKNHAHYVPQECLVQGNRALVSRVRQDSFLPVKVAHPAHYVTLGNQQMEKVIHKVAHRVALEVGSTAKAKLFVKDVRPENFQSWPKVRLTIVLIALLANILTEYEVLSAFTAQQVNTMTNLVHQSAHFANRGKQI